MKSHTKVLVPIAIALAFATSAANATLLSFGISGVGSYTVNTGNITAGTATKTLPGTEQASGTTTPTAYTLAGLSDGLAVTFSTLTLNTTNGPFAFTLTAGNLIFTFTDVTLASIVPTGVNTRGSISEQFNGSVTADTSVGHTFLNQTASISETCTESGLGASVTCSESVITPGLPRNLPEPTSLLLMGIGLAGLGGMFRRRRQRGN